MRSGRRGGAEVEWGKRDHDEQAKKQSRRGRDLNEKMMELQRFSTQGSGVVCEEDRYQNRGTCCLLSAYDGP